MEEGFAINKDSWDKLQLSIRDNQTKEKEQGGHPVKTKFLKIFFQIST